MDWSDDDDDAEGCAPPRTMKPRGPAPGRSTPSSATTRSSASSTRDAGTSCGSSPPPRGRRETRRAASRGFVDANVDEWLALLKSSEDTSDGDDAGGVTGATGVFDEDGDLVGFGSTVVYGGDTDAPFGWVGNIVIAIRLSQEGSRVDGPQGGARLHGRRHARGAGRQRDGRAAVPQGWVRARRRRPPGGRCRGTRRSEFVQLWFEKRGDVATAVDAIDATADWSEGDGALITDMDAAVFGACRGNTLRAWRDTGHSCPSWRTAWDTPSRTDAVASCT